MTESRIYRLMVGVLMSDKTLTGLGNKWPGRYPNAVNVAGIFVDHELALNLIHYNTHLDTKTVGALFGELMAITEIGGPHLDGFQLNMAWPPVYDLESYRETHPEKTIVLQIDRRAMEQIDESPKSLADMIRNNYSMIDAILIDPSGGKGELFDAEKALGYLREIRNRGYPIDLGLAGGLSSVTLKSLIPILAEIPNLCMDAEGKMRTPQPEDSLNLDAMKAYLMTACGMGRRAHTQTIG